MKKLLIASIIAMSLLGLTGQAMATHVDLLPGSNAAAQLEAIPTSTLLTSVMSPFAYGQISGNLYQEVRRDDSDSMLIFVYKLYNTSANLHYIRTMTTVDFAGYVTEVAYSTSSVLPLLFTRDPAGSVIGFEFSNYSATPPAYGINGGEESATMWIKTNAESFGPSYSSIINGGSQNVFTYGPKVPEPTSAMLLGLGLLGFAGKLRRKFMA